MKPAGPHGSLQQQQQQPPMPHQQLSKKRLQCFQLQWHLIMVVSPNDIWTCFKCYIRIFNRHISILRRRKTAPVLPRIRMLPASCSRSTLDVGTCSYTDCGMNMTRRLCYSPTRFENVTLNCMGRFLTFCIVICLIVKGLLLRPTAKMIVTLLYFRRAIRGSTNRGMWMRILQRCSNCYNRNCYVSKY